MLFLWLSGFVVRIMQMQCALGGPKISCIAKLRVNGPIIINSNREIIPRENGKRLPSAAISNFNPQSSGCTKQNLSKTHIYISEATKE